MSLIIKNVSRFSNIRIEKNPLSAAFNDFFSSGESGIWYDPSDLSTLYQDSSGTVSVTANNDPVGRINDKSGNANYSSQTTSSYRPLYNTNGTLNWLEFDGTDDYLQGTITESFSGGVTIATKIRFNGSLNSQCIFSKRDGVSENNIQLGTSSSGGLSFVGWGLNIVTSTFSGSLSSGQWYYIEASYDPTNSLVKIRVDDTIETFSNTGTLDNTVSTFRLGEDWYNNHADISMNELFVYGRALDSDESNTVKGLMS